MKKLALALAVAAFLPAASALADSYDIDGAHSQVGFTVKHLGISLVHGKFTKYTGTIEIDDKNVANDKVNVEIDATSIDTGVEKRDGHLKSPDFFDTAKFPKITFVSKSAKAGAAAGKIEVTGDLTMHGVTKSVTLQVSDVSAEILNPMDKAKHRGATATTSIKRSDFGIKWNPTGKIDDVVSDNVDIRIDLELINKKK
jgi:polyisoprenoid-binding protein YceI